jgi:hypothetical protein
VPQLAASDCSSTHVLPQSENPLLHEQGPQSHVVLQTRDPLTSQLSAAEGVQAPAGCEQVDHADQAPSELQVRVCVPQLPHDCDVGPLHAHLPAVQMPLSHFLPQAPQSFASLDMSTHESPQAAYPSLHWMAHLPARHADCPCVGAGQVVSQLPQWFASSAVSTQDLPQTVPEHVLAHFTGEDEASQIAAVPEQDVLHAPQWSAVSSAVSQPSLGSPLQSPHPTAHDDAGKAHLPPSQATDPPTCGKAVQSFEQEPQVFGSSGATQSPSGPQESSSLAQPHGPNRQEAVHVWTPFLPHVCVSPSVHTPSPVHALQSLKAPLRQVRDWLPQRPHARELGPSHDVATGAALPGSVTLGVTDDQEPHGGVDSVFG